MSARKKPAARRSARRGALTLSQRVERLERHYFAEKPAVVVAAPLRFTNLGANGKPTNEKHVAVHDSKTGLTWSVDVLGGDTGMTWKDAKAACAAELLLGLDGWRLPTIQELLSIVDYGKYNPAVDQAHFRGPYGWTWSSTEYTGSAGYAWVVGLGYGGSYYSDQGIHLHVRAVRSGQQLGLSV